MSQLAESILEGSCELMEKRNVQANIPLGYWGTSGSQLPSAQKNPHATVVHLSGGCSEPLHKSKRTVSAFKHRETLSYR